MLHLSAMDGSHAGDVDPDFPLLNLHVSGALSILTLRAHGHMLDVLQSVMNSVVWDISQHTGVISACFFPAPDSFELERISNDNRAYRRQLVELEELGHSPSERLFESGCWTCFGPP